MGVAGTGISKRKWGRCGERCQVGWAQNMHDLCRPSEEFAVHCRRKWEALEGLM